MEIKNPALFYLVRIGVYVNDEQIGNIPKEMTNEIDKIMDDIMNINIEVYGGGKSPDGSEKSFGCVIFINV